MWWKEGPHVMMGLYNVGEKMEKKTQKPYRPLAK
jgi:hypothetical protein